MSPRDAQWDYLILTASNSRQASAYESQLAARREAGRLGRARNTLVVADLEGKRIGSGGSTVQCLRAVVRREARAGESEEQTLRRLRVLIIHAGGDSRRLPAYGPCGKIFLPVPGDSDGELGRTLFDLLAPAFMDLPAGAPGQGQVVVAAGDALIRIDMRAVRLDRPGITGVGSWASPEEAARHGVYCVGGDGRVRLYLQKPPVDVQRAAGAVNGAGRTILDTGVMSFDGASAAALLRAFPGTETMLKRGVDLYREVCCALGDESTLEHYIRSAQGSGSNWTREELAAAYPALSGIAFWAEVSPRCEFLHFGSTRQLIDSGMELSGGGSLLIMNSAVHAEAAGEQSWVEGCRIAAPLKLGGRNVVVGLDVDAPLELPRGACIDVLSGEGGWFIRCYGVEDDFKTTAERGGTFCGRPLLEWMAAVGGRPEEFWREGEARSLWSARVFPCQARPDFAKWLWMFEPERASEAQKRAYLAAQRYSAEEIAWLSDQDAFHARRRAFNRQRV
jgi:fucokinase